MLNEYQRRALTVTLMSIEKELFEMGQIGTTKGGKR